MDKIIFFHMNQLGDLLFSLPVLKAAKEELNSQNYSLVSKELAPLLIASGLVDFTLDKNSSSIDFIKNKKFDIAILFSESPSSLAKVFFSKIRTRIGFKTASLNFLLTKKIKRFGVPSLSNNMELGKSLGLKNIQKDYTDILDIPKETLKSTLEWFVDNKLDLLCTIAISVGASKRRQNKCLESSKWIEIIDALTARGLKCVLCGAKLEEESLDNIATKCKIKPKLFVAQGGILESAAFLKLCKLFVGIDSGAMHLAAAVKTKCIAVFGCTDPYQVGPMPLDKHVIIRKENIKLIKSEDIISAVLHTIQNQELKNDKKTL